MSNIKESKTKVILITLMVMCVIFMCGACSALALSGGGDDTVEKEVTRIVREEVTVVETRLVETEVEVEVTKLVEVPVEVEVEVEVTRLVEAEAEPTPESDDTDVLEYTSIIVLTMADMGEGMSEIGTLMTDAGSNPAIIFETTWKDSLLYAVDELTQGCITIRETEAPVIFAETHDYLLLACDEFDVVTFELATFGLLPSLDDVGIGRLERATSSMAAGTQYISLATAVMP